MPIICLPALSGCWCGAWWFGWKKGYVFIILTKASFGPVMALTGPSVSGGLYSMEI